MIAAVADTHTVLWHLYDNARLSVAAGNFIDRAAVARSQIVISAITLAEIVYLIETNRLPTVRSYTDLRAALDEPGHARMLRICLIVSSRGRRFILWLLLSAVAEKSAPRT